MKKFFVIALALIFVLALTGVAFALGPHGGYTNSTNHCASCHDVHDAVGPNDSAFGIVLLKYTTVFGACQYCHDGTAGQDGLGVNVINVITNNGGGVPVAQHRPTGTFFGNYANESLTYSSIGLTADMTLTCTDCHSVHDNPNRVITTPFSCDTTTTVSSHLLLRDPKGNGIGGTTDTLYNGWWCADCHVNRHSGTDAAGMNNHPVNTGTYTYATANLARNNASYRMAPVGSAPRTSPICMQCHEDARNCDQAFTAPSYGPGALTPATASGLPYASVWWSPTATNPRFFTFPHESTVARFKVETGDGLCLNCHLTTSLP